ncbi:MAG: ECF transporter S component [Oscillospiraceae bacterium]
MENNKTTSKKGFTTRQIVLVGLMAAIVFLTNYISFKIPLIAGAPTRIHIANGFCLLAGLTLGGLNGGLAAGIGSMLYDFTNPAYIASAPFTFLFKFLMSFIAGKTANLKDRQANDIKFNILACVAGQVTYIVLYLGKKFITGLLIGNAVETVITTCLTSLFASTVNAVIAIVIAMVLLPVFKMTIKRINK